MKGIYPLTSGYAGGGVFPPVDDDSLLDQLKAAGYTTYLSGREHYFGSGRKRVATIRRLALPRGMINFCSASQYASAVGNSGSAV